MEEIKNIKTSGVSGTRLFVGVILILLGGLFLLDNLDLIYIDIPRIIFSLPMLLIIFGAIIIINSRKKIFGALIFILGVFLMLPRVFPWIHFNASIVFPIIIILLGIFIITRRRNNYSTSASGVNSFQNTKGHNLNADKIDEISIFGGAEKIVYSENFQGGNVTSIFGGSTIDLTNCKLAPGENVIDVLAIFGGNTFIVPKDWEIRTDIFPLFGGFSNKVFRDPSTVVNQEKVLLIKGFVLFGGGEIKNYH
ncbi:MAG: LiaF domain-containing protein [Ignavibacteriaceae bacterium]